MSGPGGEGATESTFEVVATPSGLAHLVLTSGAADQSVSTMTTMLGQRRYDQLASYASSPAAKGLSADRRQLIVAEAQALN